MTAFPLTPLQHGMLYESTLSGRPWLNLEQIVVHLEDAVVDAALMQKAWVTVTAAHDGLRTVIDLAGSDGPMQRVVAQADVELAIHDLSAQADPHSALAAWLAKDRNQGIDPATLPGFRLALLTLGPRHQTLVWTFPHTLLDGRSFAPILTQVFAIYAGSEPVLTPAPAFADHCHALAGLSHDASRAYFTNYLSGFDAPNTVIHAARARPARKQVLQDGLSATETQALTARATQAGVTTATLVQAAWGIVLARWSGRDDAVFGATVSGRHLMPGQAGTIGCLINTLPLRLRITPTTTVDALLARLRADQLDQRPHAQMPLVLAHQATDIPANRALFDSMVMFERASLGAQMRALGGAWAKRRVDLHEEGALPLTLAIYADPEMLVRLEYDPGLIPDGARLLGYVMATLRALIAVPGDAPVAALDMLGDERAALLALGMPTAVTTSGCIADRFEAAAARTPDGIAIRHEQTALTFAALDAQANRLAHLLRGKGITQGALVGIALPRSPAFIIAALGVLKSGAGFVPMDPTYPPDVLAMMQADSGMALVIGADLDTGSAPPTPPDRAGMTTDRTAYVIYTSGSTGRPKGVVIPHRSFTAHNAAMIACFGLTPQDRVLQFASLSFDVALEEIFPTLLAGATVVMRSDAMAESSGAFLDGITAQGVTVINLPTAFWLALLDDMEMGNLTLPPGVRLVIVGGERIPAAALARWRKTVPNIAFMNGYGPTEATITCAVHIATDISDDVPIGRPVGHARLYVVAADGSLAPRGAAGELWVGGDAVATGYLHRDNLTAAHFLPDPFGPGRVYRTGDLVRWGASGALAFIGRADRQIKLRGYRIEPAQIEAVIDAHPGVTRALVAVDSGRLLAWVSGTADHAALQQAIKVALPRQMWPVLVPVQDWPQTPGGKVDMARLPRPGAAQPTAIAPADASTLQICAMFGTILNQHAANPDADFFDLGGHSLLLIRLVGMIDTAFGRRLSVAEIHANPTPRGIAASVRIQRPAAAQYVVPIQPQGSRPPIYGVHVLGPNESYFRPLAKALGPDQPLFGLTVGLLTKDTPVSVTETATLYFSDIMRHQPDGPLSLVAVSLGSYVAFELAQQLLAAGRDVTMLAILDAEGPGGRKRIAGLKRLAAHRNKMRSVGVRYLLQSVQHRVDDLRHWAEKTRLKYRRKHGSAFLPNLTIEEFVAANTLAVEDYHARPYPRRLTIVRARDNLFDSAESLKSGLGWRSVAAGGLDLVEVPGDHLTILQMPAVQSLAHVLQRAMSAD